MVEMIGDRVSVELNGHVLPIILFVVGIYVGFNVAGMGSHTYEEISDIALQICELVVWP